MINPQEPKMSLEKQFSLASFSTQVDLMSLEQAKAMLKMLYQQMVTREALYNELLKHQWGLDGELNSGQPKGESAS